jgi:hypothetical protein
MERIKEKFVTWQPWNESNSIPRLHWNLRIWVNLSIIFNSIFSLNLSSNFLFVCWTFKKRSANVFCLLFEFIYQVKIFSDLQRSIIKTC